MQNQDYIKQLNELLVHSRHNGFTLEEIVAYIIRIHHIDMDKVNNINQFYNLLNIEFTLDTKKDISN